MAHQCFRCNSEVILDTPRAAHCTNAKCGMTFRAVLPGEAVSAVLNRLNAGVSAPPHNAQWLSPKFTHKLQAEFTTTPIVQWTEHFTNLTLGAADAAKCGSSLSSHGSLMKNDPLYLTRLNCLGFLVLAPLRFKPWTLITFSSGVPSKRERAVQGQGRLLRPHRIGG